ncbi:hypothetical protein EJ08DRAFT_675208 [Tothia fuscella]|uniref:AB hydrolase-1 domain-containing protein n=1 Tax=Tothia fuscella TaxID=1048955 RepID=A0A9P4P2D4_9PEZI|nr:hypothetical protein EJ08DRAFT_675208 [Tothia fuscella]
MLNNTTGEYLFIRGCIIFLRSIAPLSISYITLLSLGLLRAYRLPLFIEIITALETVWYACFWIYRKSYLQRPAVHPRLYSEETRRKLVTRCIGLIPDYEAYISKWFLGADPTDVKRENMKEFFRWAFFNTAVPNPSHDEELADYIRQLERAIGRKIEPGRSDVKCLRLTLDNVVILHRSLVWYFCVSFVDNLTYFWLLFQGFQFYRMSLYYTFSVFPPRLQTLVGTSPSPAPDLSYWFRPHTSKSKLPILFLHGIGIGLYPYCHFLAELKQKGIDGDVGIIAVEIMPISFRITSEATEKDTLCKKILAVLDHHGFDEFVLVSHSYGSIITTHLLRDPYVSTRISSMVIIDPISILLHHPDVAYNMMIRQPQTAQEWQLWYFASKDAGVAHTLARRFFWFENILWREDIADRRATVFLSERDLLVNTPEVRNYLLEDSRKEDVDGTRRLSVVWCKGLDHGQVFETKKWRGRLLDEVRKISSKRVVS